MTDLKTECHAGMNILLTFLHNFSNVVHFHVSQSDQGCENACLWSLVLRQYMWCPSIMQEMWCWRC